MGWHIHCVENTVKVTPELVQELILSETEIGFTWQDEGADPIREVTRHGVLPFNSDHMEHMDYVWDKDVQRVLKRHKVKGSIAFVSHDGDNRNTQWSYTFDGKGGMKEVRGPIVGGKKTSKKR